LAPGTRGRLCCLLVLRVGYSYDIHNNLTGLTQTVTYNGTTYYYATNLQGDVVAILDSTGATVVSYTYDAWGNPTSTTGTLATTLGTVNPLRYRGYVYDTETGLYYIICRYFNSEIGRWLSPEPNVDCGEFDIGAKLLGCNVYVYCANNPVLLVDDSGEFLMLAFASVLSVTAAKVVVALVATLVVVATAELIIDVISETRFSFAKGRTKKEADTYGRPNQKKQGREVKNKNRQKDNYRPKNNRRDGKPAPPKHHTPGRDHQRFNQSRKTKLDMNFKKIG